MSMILLVGVFQRAAFGEVSRVAVAVGLALLLTASPSYASIGGTLFTFESIPNEVANTATIIETVGGTDLALALTGSTTAAGGSGLLTTIEFNGFSGRETSLGVFSFEDSGAPTIGDFTIGNSPAIDTLSFSFDFAGELAGFAFTGLVGNEVAVLRRASDNLAREFAPSGFAGLGQEPLELDSTTGPGFAPIAFAAGDEFTLVAESRGFPFFSNFGLIAIGVNAAVPEPTSGLIWLVGGVAALRRGR